MSRPRKLKAKDLKRLKKRLLSNTPLYQIAPMFKVHPRTLSRRIHEDSDLEELFFRSCTSQAAERILKRDEERKHSSNKNLVRHPLRSIFDYERLHPELPRHHGRHTYRDGIAIHPELCKPCP